jgi:hypothetical protein
MPRFDPNKIPSARRHSMRRYLTGEIQTNMSLANIALHVGLKEEQVKNYLEHLRKRKKITTKSPFHK